MMKLWNFFASFFGIGYVPIAPGTLASFIVVILYKLFLWHLSWPVYILLFLLICIVGVLTSSAVSRELKENDPRRVVIDEVCGQLAVLILVPPTWVALGLAFGLFRLFDIVKPFPVRTAERLPDGWGIMADDFVAAVMTKIVVHLYLIWR